MSNSSPRVTVGIPFFNEEGNLAAAVRSILAQTEGDLELLLIDDGSTDRSVEVAHSFDDPRVTVLSDRMRCHLPARLNEIVRRARGALVARMDADDVSHPERLARELAVIDQDSRCDAVGTWAGLVDDDDRIFAVVEAGRQLSSREAALTRGFIPHATLLARRSWLLANPYDEALTRAEDRDLWCRTAGISRFAVVEEPLYVVRVEADDDRFLADYLEAQRQNRTLMLRYGPETLGGIATARSWLASHAKGLVMRTAVNGGLGRRLVRRRGRPPTATERALIEQALASAQPHRP
jgi:glycosyltransferase involved in cell wall biosynthesis